jgi:hypothetical protein
MIANIMSIKEGLSDEEKRTLAKELATKINAAVNLPLVSEAAEQVVFEMVMLLLIDLVLGGR